SGSAAAANLDPGVASTVVLRRHAGVANIGFAWKLSQLHVADPRQLNLRFARDYSFRELKANGAILLGNGRTNPWIQPFELNLGLRWEYDSSGGVSYPVDTADPGKNFKTGDGYFSVALLPNLGNTGNVLIVSSTGGSAMNGGADFLADSDALSALRQR